MDYSSLSMSWIIIILLVLSGLCSASETALASTNLIRLKTNYKGKRIKLICRLIENYSSALTTILILNNLINITNAAIGTYIFTSLYGSKGILYSTLIITFITLIFGEILPKILAKEYPEQFLLFIIYPLDLVVKLTKPLSFLVVQIETLFKNKKNNVTATEKELLNLVQTIESEGVLNQDERVLIENAIKFDDKIIKEIMVPKKKVINLFVGSNQIEVEKLIKKEKYSRIPVLDEQTGQVVGILHETDVIDNILHKKEIVIKEIMQPALYLREELRLPLALEKIQRSRAHMGIVVNNLEEKKYLGIVTLEDILEELVGEIYDEYDELPKNVIEVGLHSYEVNPNLKIIDFFKKYLDDIKVPNTKAITFKEWMEELINDNKFQEGIYKYNNIILRFQRCYSGKISKIFIEKCSVINQ